MSDNKFEIDVQAFAKTLQSGQPINGKDGLLTPLIKQVTEAALARMLIILCQPIFTDPRKSIRRSKWMLSCCSVRFRFCTGYVY
jgi:hypothetical protein